MSSLAPTTVELSVISDADMAWMLADAADMCLMGHERTMTFVELGCREHHLAIERILYAVLSSGMVLPAAIFDGLTRWLHGYAGSPEEPHLRTIVADVRVQQVEPVPMRAQQALPDDSWADAARHHISSSSKPCARATSTATPGAMCTRNVSTPPTHRADSELSRSETRCGAR